MGNKEFIAQLREQNEQILAVCENLEKLSGELLEEIPSFGGWSVGQCLDHMNRASELYLDQIETKLPDLRTARKETFKPTFLATYSKKSQAPTAKGEIRNKMKTLKPFVPGSSINALESLHRIQNNLDRYEHILQKLEGKDLRSFKVVTALGPILKFHVGDAMDFIHAHNRRHVQQIKNILADVATEEVVS